MQDAACVSFLESLDDFRRDLQRAGRFKRTVSQHKVQRPPGDMLHDDARLPVDLGDLVDLADVGVIQRGR